MSYKIKKLLVEMFEYTLEHSKREGPNIWIEFAGHVNAITVYASKKSRKEGEKYDLFDFLTLNVDTEEETLSKVNVLFKGLKALVKEVEDERL